VAGPGGHWGLATIRRVNEDGTFQIEFDVKQMVLMRYWYGATSAEISFDDARQWGAVFAQISPDGRSFTLTNFQDAASRMGYQVTLDQSRQLWSESCQKLFNISESETESSALDEAMAYQLFLHLRASAKQCSELLRADWTRPYFKLYWNQTRMGGREPAEIHRRVTLDDALAALGLTANEVDESAVAFFQRFEQEHAIRLPGTLKELLQCDGIADAVTDCHPNNPNLVPLEDGEWILQRGMREKQLGGDYAIVIMLPHQGDHEWAVVFDDGEDDARVYLRWDLGEGVEWQLTAPGIGMFFWDLAQTGLAWYQHTRFEGGKPVKRSDIGLVLDL